MRDAEAGNHDFSTIYIPHYERIASGRNPSDDSVRDFSRRFLFHDE